MTENLFLAETNLCLPCIEVCDDVARDDWSRPPDLLDKEYRAIFNDV